MKASGVTYWRADSVDAALVALRDSGGAARLLAGGQSLVASLNLRLADEVALIDINGLAELEGVEDAGELDFLRLDLGLTGSHAGCEHGVCGACTVRVDGEIVRGCLMLAAQLDGAEVWTIEGPRRRRARPSGRLRGAQRAAMRVLHAGHAVCRGRPPGAGRRAGPRGDPRAHLGQLLPLHRLRGDRRRDRDRWPGPRGGGGGRDDHRFRQSRPPEQLYRPHGAAPERAGWSRARALTSTTSCCRACCMWPSCAAPCPCPDRADRHRGGAGGAGRACASSPAPISPRSARPGSRCWPSQGAEIGAAASARRGARHLGGRARGRRGGRQPRAAEDGAALVDVDYEPLPAVTDMETALDPDTGDPSRSRRQPAFRACTRPGDVDAAFADRRTRWSRRRFKTGRHTGVCLEPRSILADYNPAEGQLTVYHSTQAPHMMQTVLRQASRLPEGGCG
jgi:hypothetical protein